MAKGSPRALPTRAVLTAVVGALAYLVMMQSPTELRAQTPTPEGTVRLIPAISSVPADGGPFTVFIVLEDLRHFGALAYDDNRDTVPDRYIESDGLAAFEFTIQYDSRALSFVSVEQGPDLGRTGRPFDCLPPAREANRVTFGCVSTGPEPAGPQGTLTLGTVTFAPAGTGSSPLLVQADLSGPLGSDAVPVDVRGGVVRIVGRPAPKGTGQPAAGTPAPTVTGEATSSSGGGTVTPRATSLATGSSSRTPTPRGNGDGGVPLVGGGGGAGGSIRLWLGIAVGCASAALLAVAAVAWQRRHRAGV